MSGCGWSGVFPAATTQFDAALDVDLAGSERRAEVIGRVQRARDARPRRVHTSA